MRMAPRTGVVVSLVPESDKRNMRRICSRCSVEFSAKRHKSANVYCSMKCYRARKPKVTTSTCGHCSKTFRTYPNWMRRGGGKFCSRTCKSLSIRNGVERTCDVCSVKFHRKPAEVKNSGAKYCSTKCCFVGLTGKKRPNCSGELNPRWLGGISRHPYPFAFNDELKERIRLRDGFVCQLCSLTNEEHIVIYGYDLIIHHIDYVKHNLSDDNLITACIQCNSRVNFNRDYWTDFFKQKQGARNENQI